MANYDQPVPSEKIEKAQAALEENGMKVTVVADRAAALATVLELVPKMAEVLTVTSRTLEETGIATALNESGDYDAVRPKLNALMGDPAKKQEQRKLGAAPEYVVGSVHAITQDGQVLIASNTGSQLPAYVYGAGQVLWVVGAQKITKDLTDAEARLKQHVFPLEDARARKAYGFGTNISKQLVISKEVTPDRITVIIVKEALGY